MIVDFHTHAFPDGLAARALGKLLSNSGAQFEPVTDGTVSGLLRHMEKSGVDVSVVLPIVTKPTQFEAINEWAASIGSGRLVAFGSIYPHTASYKRDIDFVAGLGLKGLKFHCEYQDFVLDDPKMLPVYDYALSRGLILVFHAGLDPGYPPPYKSSPRQFADIVRQLKGGVIVAAHLGGHSEWDDVERYLVGTEIYLDTSMGFEYFPTEQFLRIVRNHGADRILFASDSPWSDAKAEIAAISALPIEAGKKEMILGGNASRLLGMQRAPDAGSASPGAPPPP